MSRILQKATLYVLGLEDPAGGPVPPYYKLGITTDTVDKRIRQLQTGNPYRIVALHTLEIEGAEIVEQNLHRVYAPHRRILEWFELSDDELAAVLRAAEDLRDDIEALVVEVRGLDQQPSNNVILNATPEAQTLHQEAVALEGAKTQNSLKVAVLRSRLAALTGAGRGIVGITVVLVTSPTSGFSRMALKADDEDLYRQYLTIPEFKHSLKVLGKPTPRDFPQLNAEKTQAAAAVPAVAAEEVTPDRTDRTVDVVQLHSEYIDLVSMGGDIDRDLMMVKMRLKTLCGQARGIDGVCEYVREDRMTFDEDSFMADHPGLYEQFTIQRQPQRRLAVKRSRDY